MLILPSTFIDTVINATGDAYDAVDENDIVTVASSGVLYSSQGYGINCTADYVSVVLDGAAYSAEWAGVWVQGAQTSVFVNGIAEGANSGVVLSGATDDLNVGSAGQVVGAHSMYGMGVTLEATAQNDQILNSGLISGNGAGIWADKSLGSNSIGNNGEIIGYVAVLLYGEQQGDYVVNSGKMVASGEGVLFESCLKPNFLTNSGVISGTGGIYLDDQPGVVDSIVNTGQISGVSSAIYVSGGSLTLSNSGSILGGFYSSATSAVTIDNSGLLQAGPLIAGAPSPGLTLTDTGDIVRNSGKILAPISMTDGADRLSNSGTITGAVTFVGAGAGGDRLVNSGVINGAIAMGAGAEYLTNAGTINGSITFAGSGGVLTNRNQIYGGVKMAASNRLTDYGAIQDNVALGAGDTLIMNGGKVRGAIIAGGGDAFIFRGAFGRETIDNFVGGNGASRDILGFSVDEFSSYSALAGAMTQAGSSVLIKLDAADTIALAGVTLSSLVAADFKFVA